MTFKISKTLLRKMEEHALRSFPEECCGFLVGIMEEAKEVSEIIESKNTVSTMRERRYTVDPLQFLRVEKDLYGSRREILGFYHSHPNAPARPSQYDLEHAWPVYSYLIISLSEQGTLDVASWTLAEGDKEFRRENLVIVS